MADPRYSFDVVWYEFPSRRSVAGATCDSREKAFEEAVLLAFRLGYTTPRWWQYWRWRERRLAYPLARHAGDDQHDQK